MASEHEVNEKAMPAMSLRRRNRTISQIALIWIAKSAMSILCSPEPRISGASLSTPMISKLMKS